MKIVKGIQIDPFACTVSFVEHDASDYRGIYPLISHETMKVNTFTILHLDDGDAIFIDDDGRLKPCDRFFEWVGYHTPIAGKGLILGADKNGDTASVKMSLTEARKSVRFAERFEQWLRYTDEPWQKVKL